MSLYSAHLEALYKGLLIHLDDPEARIQEAVLGAIVCFDRSLNFHRVLHHARNNAEIVVVVLPYVQLHTE